MNEADTRAELIDPALKEAGWGVAAGSRVRREVITLGRLQGAGQRTRGDIADYVLFYQGQKLAVIEAKKRDLPVTEGLAQAKRYAERLQTRFAYATNGLGLYRVDMHTGEEGPVAGYPTPEELWAETFPEPNSWRERFGEVPFHDNSGQWQARYYQHNAINQALEAIAAGRLRVLLTLATGTGKTAIAFQLAWKLFHSRWNLAAWQGDESTRRRPRILFLADRNILADQAYNSFSAFPEDALVRIAPDTIRKQGRVPKNGNLFFTIFQTFMSSRDDAGNPAPSFGDYPPDFFDLIIIDECHRGGANDESSWRAILEYFSPAVQLGLTATPKRSTNTDTYAYFGEPAYVYSLKEGINDGFLTPFKVRQIATTLDDYVYTPDDKVIQGEVEEGRRYAEPDFNRLIRIKEREQYRVKVFMEMIDQRDKTLVFCANQAHALAVRDLINQAKTNTAPDYCVRVDPEWDGEPMAPEPCTRCGEMPCTCLVSPPEPCEQCGNRPCTCEVSPPEPCPVCGEAPCQCDGARPPVVEVELAPGKFRQLQHMSATTFWSPDGKPMSAAEFIRQLFGELPALFQDEDELRRLWSRPDTRQALLDTLAEKGYGSERLREIGRLVNAENSDLFDVLAYIAFDLPPLSRVERVASHRNRLFADYDYRQQEFVRFVLDHYINEGIGELAQDKLPRLIELKYQTPSEAIAELGSVENIREVFIGFQARLYD
ncbi:MAG: DEAD/DEAH box helicase family protein [Halomonas sp.]|nr:DEAD/DEAH box helicase family protein [Halomonas sp.]